jgi:hypothetical protein
MALTVSEHLGLDQRAFRRAGAFDTILKVDSKFFIDPRLLSRTRVPELRRSYRTVQAHFGNVLRLLGASRARQDAFWRQAERLMTYREPKGLCIGYSSENTSGSGIGSDIRNRMIDTAKQIVDAGIRDPRIFELMGLLEEGVGADRISDMIANMIADDLHRYSQRIYQSLDVPRNRLRTFMTGNTTYRLPKNPFNRQPIILIPRSILRDLPVGRSRDEIQVVVAYNERLRRWVNDLIGRTGQRLSISAKKQIIRERLLRRPALLRRLLAEYGHMAPAPYDFSHDPAGQVVWAEASRNFTAAHPLRLALSRSPNRNETVGIVRQLSERFKRLIENNGLNQVLYDERRRPRRERFAQLLFYGIADAYSEANNLDLSREPNAGRGPVDFKVSRGYRGRVLVEVKLSTNTRLLPGFTAQLATYAQAEQADDLFYVIIDVGGSRGRIRSIRDLVAKRRRRNRPTPEVILVDARLMPSASRLH